jgi:hypothetical protein
MSSKAKITVVSRADGTVVVSVKSTQGVDLRKPTKDMSQSEIGLVTFLMALNELINGMNQKGVPNDEVPTVDSNRGLRNETP